MSNPIQLTNPYPKSSRYYQTKMFVDNFVKDGTARFGLWKAPALRAFPELNLREGQYTTYMVTESDLNRIDLLAYKFYGDVSLWWVLCLFNKIYNPLTDMVVGQVLKIPKKSLIIEAMTKKSGNT